MSYIIRRALYTLILMVAISMVAFVVIQLPPGDYVTAYIAELQQSSRGSGVNTAMADALRKSLGVDRPIHIQYVRWIWGMLQGDMGRSLAWRKPVSELVAGAITADHNHIHCQSIFRLPYRYSHRNLLSHPPILNY